MFQSATKFDQPIGEWDIANVKDLRSLFKSATSLSTCNKRLIADAWSITMYPAQEYNGVFPYTEAWKDELCPPVCVYRLFLARH
jgi:hypothetical protein